MIKCRICNVENAGWENSVSDLCYDCHIRYELIEKQHKKQMSKGKANTFKFSTIVFLILGLIIPLWPISLPIFWYLAYKSYSSGIVKEDHTSTGNLDELKKLKELLDLGVISQEEFDAKKRTLFR